MRNHIVLSSFMIMMILVFNYFFMELAKANIKEQCPHQYADNLHKKTIDYFGYRLAPQIEMWGCEVVPVYTAFGNENCETLEVAEDNPDMMEQLIKIMEETPDLPKVLNKFPHLTQALDQRLKRHETKEEFWDILKNMGENQTRALLQGKPIIAAITLLIPNSSPVYLSKNFTNQQLDLLLKLIDQTALTSSLAQAEGIEELLPFITSNPTDALNIYKKVLIAWGEKSFIKLLQESPDAVSSMVPPLTIKELDNLSSKVFNPTEFHKMQEDYIKLIRELYANARNQYGSAWAAEYCISFADILPLALLGASNQDYNNIRRFMLDLLHGEFFIQILKPSACNEKSNLSLLGLLLTSLTVGSQTLNAHTQGLTALAAWHTSGKIMPIIQAWLPYTSSTHFNQQISDILGGNSNPENWDDYAFWEALIQLALIRSNLDPVQQNVLDKLCHNLMRKNIHPSVTLSFINNVQEPLFQIVNSNKNFRQPYEVAERLLLAGYPDSDDPSIYQLALSESVAEYMPKARNVIAHRGGMSETNLLQHGQTFADTHGGWSVWEMADTAETVISISATAFFTVSTGGAGTPLLAMALTRVGAKQAARQAGKVAAKALAKGIRKLPKIVRPIVKYTLKGGKIVLETYKPISKNASIAEKALNHGENFYQTVSAARKIHDFLMPEHYEEDQIPVKPAELCPEK